MESEKKLMKILKIEDGKGYLVDKNGNFVEVDKLDRELLLNLVELVFDNDVEMDEYNESLIPNKVQQIIYKDLYQKLSETVQNKQQQIENINLKYKDALEKYLSPDLTRKK